MYLNPYKQIFNKKSLVPTHHFCEHVTGNTAFLFRPNQVVFDDVSTL